MNVLAKGTMCWVQVAPRILWKEGLQCFRSYIVLEGGSIHVDGEGCVAPHLCDSLSVPLWHWVALTMDPT